ncbi:hypothetical protein F3N42_08730 [Marinihelvus fidelis]|uniref:3-hydroxylacyl-ACP dehydratase n=1 Tax=Marinihelvus fidelis TaxID=2613842 RepID=A0A5N0TC39_9GAMM|nr:hypothetical protein [Marinihelvus fidelis]KAA9131396.1 hypothetical protein F3N42_08730 [Marinihelvus fidelis]
MKPRDFLPLRGRILMIDEILDVRRGYARTRVTADGDRPFYDPDRGWPAWVLIELFAQSVGIVAGHDARVDGDPEPRGLLLGTRRFEASRSWIEAGTVLEIEVEEAFMDPGGMAAYDGRLLNHDIEAGCRVTLYRQPPETA